MHLRVINPTTTTSWVPDTLAMFEDAASDGTTVTVATIPAGTPSIESRRDEALVTPWVLRAAQAADAEGCDAIAVDCMLDPGVHAAREVVGIPVLGPCEASMHLAATLGHRFSVISVAEHHRDLMIDQARRYGVEPRLASVRSLQIPVLELEDDPDATFRTMVARAREAVQHDHAQAIVLGCTGLAGQAAQVQSALEAEGIGVPVIDPSAAATRMLETIVAMGLAGSLITYPRRSGATSAWPEPLTRH
ncbi:aspartate/glutamate racemase family protein [Microbacterium arabinogalactanolyticum]|uniref:Asp/Glu racemase n=1 Tax=Microbacterium arabinogalactanolyticum TaxID=69365 RepID=A0ABQ5NEX9_9MICO|nr:aspartate/glutamate racemase family protein [Microbacterium arabinogalactanolyticum]GLC84203.1 Asp/Glu racemase [Microbacterium arabinogalactanolyticum]